MKCIFWKKWFEIADLKLKWEFKVEQPHSVCFCKKFVKPNKDIDLEEIWKSPPPPPGASLPKIFSRQMLNLLPQVKLFLIFLNDVDFSKFSLSFYFHVFTPVFKTHSTMYSHWKNKHVLA